MRSWEQHRAFAVRGVVLCALLFLARARNPATAQLGKWVMTGLMIEMVRSCGSGSRLRL